MFLEALDDHARSSLFETFFAETRAALLQVFRKGEHEASTLLADLGRKFADAPRGEQDLLLHNDPVALASILAEVPWSDVDAQRLEAFNARRRLSAPRA